MEEYFQIAIAAAAVLVVVILMYIGSVYMTRETSFESALAEQNRRRTETRDVSPKKPKRQQTRGKRSEKVVHAVHDDGSAIVAQPTAPHHSPGPKKKVEIELEPAIIASSEAPDVKRPVSPTKPAKSILLNKEEKSEVAASMAAPEKFHMTRQISVDELDLNFERHKSEASSSDTENKTNVESEKTDLARPAHENVGGKSKKKKQKSAPSDELLLKTSVASETSQPQTSSSDLKEVAATNAVNGVQQENLSCSSGAADDKQVKQLQLSVTKLKEQLSQKEKELTSEKARTSNMNDQLARLQHESSVEKRKIAELQSKQNSLNETERAAAQELRQTREQHAHESSVFRAQADSMKTQLGELSHSNQQLMEENRQLKGSVQHHTQKIQVLDDALQKSSATMASAENSKRHLETKVRQYEEEAAKMTSSMNDAQAKISELKEQLRGCETKMQQNSDVQQLEKRLEESEQQRTQLDAELLASKCRLLEVERKLVKDVHLQTPDEPMAVVSCASSLSSAGVSKSCQTDAAQRLLSGSSNCMSGSNSQTADVDLYEKNEELSRLQELLLAQKQRNEVLRQKNYATIEALGKMEKLVESGTRAKDDLVKKETELRCLQRQMKELQAQQKTAGSTSLSVSHKAKRATVNSLVNGVDSPVCSEAKKKKVPTATLR